jgi:hypothetical protein
MGSLQMVRPGSDMAVPGQQRRLPQDVRCQMGVDCQGHDSTNIKGRLMERLEITHFCYNIDVYNETVSKDLISDLLDNMNERAYNKLKDHKWEVEDVYPADRGMLTGWEVVYSTQIPRNKKLLLLVEGIMS